MLVWDCVKLQTSLSSLSLMLVIWYFALVLTVAVYIVRFKGSNGKICKMMTSHLRTLCTQHPGELRSIFLPWFLTGAASRQIHTNKMAGLLRKKVCEVSGFVKYSSFSVEGHKFPKPGSLSIHKLGSDVFNLHVTINVPSRIRKFKVGFGDDVRCWCLVAPLLF